MVSADVVQLALRSRFNPLRGLTPQLLSVYLDNFLLGFVAYAALVWDQIEKRDDVHPQCRQQAQEGPGKIQAQILPARADPPRPPPTPRRSTTSTIT